MPMPPTAAVDAHLRVSASPPAGGSAPVKLRSADVRWTEGDDGGLVVLDTRGGRYLSVNESGALLWTSLVAGGDESDLTAILSDQFGIGQQQAVADVRAFVGMLRERDLVE